MSASATAATVRPSRPEKNAAKAGSATISAATRNAKHGDRLAEPDRAAIARRENERVEHPLLALGDERARQPEQRREDERRPEQAERRLVARAARQREVEDRQRRDHEEEHRRQRLLRAQLEQQVLARERADVGEVGHANPSRCGRALLDALRLVRRDDPRPRLVERRVEQRGAVGVERVVRLVEQQQRRVVQQHAAEAESLLHAARERRDALVAHAPTARSARAASRPARRAPGSGRAGRTASGSRAASARDRRAARARGSRSARARGIVRSPAVGAAAPPGRAAASSCPSRSRPVTSRKPPASSSTSTPGEHAPLAVALREPACADHAPEHLGRRAVEAVRLAGGGERVGDLLHLADPAPALRAAERLGALPSALRARAATRATQRPTPRRLRSAGRRREIASSIAAVPFDQAAYVIFTAEASETIRASTIAAGEQRGDGAALRRPRGRAGRRRLAPAARRRCRRRRSAACSAPTSPARVRRDRVRVDVDPGEAGARSRATSSAACGGQMERISSASAASASTEPASRNAAARSRVAALRPSDAQITSCPPATRAAPIAEPISPGCSRPTITGRPRARRRRTRRR